MTEPNTLKFYELTYNSDNVEGRGYDVVRDHGGAVDDGVEVVKNASLYRTTLEAFRVAMTVNTSCTAYLIWHYLKNHRFDLALQEYLRDGDKLNGAWFIQGRREIKSALETLARENP